MLEKLSGEQIDRYLLKAASLLREQERKIHALYEKIASFERKDTATKIASLAVERGVVGQEDVDEYVDNLFKSDQDLRMVEDTVRQIPNSLGLGGVMSKTASEGPPGEAREALEAFLLSGDPS